MAQVRQESISCSSLNCVELTGLSCGASRKPRLLLRFEGVLLLRLATRQFVAVLFQLPPRFTRLELHGNGLCVVIVRLYALKEMAAVGLRNECQCRLDAGVSLLF